MNKIEVGGYRRITKNEARKLFQNNEQFYIFPCKVSPVNQFGIGAEIQSELFGFDFDRLIKTYEVYNCQYNEWGKYTSFYVKEA